jgi:hypothetical protein
LLPFDLEDVFTFREASAVEEGAGGVVAESVPGTGGGPANAISIATLTMSEAQEAMGARSQN